MMNYFCNFQLIGYNLVADINITIIKIVKKKHEFHMYYDHASVVAVENVVMLTRGTQYNSPWSSSG